MSFIHNSDDSDESSTSSFPEADLYKKRRRQSDRVRLFVDSSSVMDNEDQSSRAVKRGSYLEDDMTAPAFDATAIRETMVPDDVGSKISLDESAHSFNSSGLHHMDILTKTDEKAGDNESEADEEECSVTEPETNEGVLFSKNDLDNYEQYRKANKTSFMNKKSYLFAGAVLIALGFVGGLAVVLGGRVSESNEIMEKRQSFNARASEYFALADQEHGQFDLDEPDPDGGAPIFKIRAPPPNNGDSPRDLASLAPLSDPFTYQSDTPFLWMIPRTSGIQIRDTIGHCFSHMFSREYKGDQTDVVFSHLPYKVANSFNGYKPPQRGRMFAMFREPTLRSLDMWYSHMEEEGEISLENYLKNHHDNNWMTRFLTNNFSRGITDEDFEMAKTILREKVIVGLDEEKHESFERFVRYFQWDTLSLDVQQCIDIVMNTPGYMHDVEYPMEFTLEYDLLKQRNRFDTPLYEYAKQLYATQSATLFTNMAGH